MGLKVKIRDGRGITTGYHKIGRFIVDTENRLVQVLVRHYTDETFRELEKEKQEFRDEFKEKHARLQELVAEDSEETIEERIELTDHINSIQEVKDNEPTFVVSDSNEVLAFDSEVDYSLAGVYNELKKLDKYRKSKDV